MKNFGIYIHWPFCLSKCPYCDFASTACKNADETLLLQGYLRDLKALDKSPVSSIFFGGGTPSMMSPEMVQTIIDTIDKDFGLSSKAEISMEANPEAITRAKMQDFKSAGVNRLSLGVQALNQADLKFLGRIHSLNTAIERIAQMRQVFDNCSIDLIYARPNQTTDDWEKELTQVLSFDVPHISLYQLTVEQGTAFDRRGVEVPDDEQARALYLKTFEMMEKAQIPLYEVSNFARSGFECRHNLLYWQGDDYAGIGPAAHGRLGLTATENPANVGTWLKQGTLKTLLTAQERQEEKIMMGLRLRRGMTAKGIESQKIDAAVLKGWLFYDARNGWIAPTMEGLLMLNQLVLMLI